MDLSQITHMHIMWLQNILDDIRYPAKLDPEIIARCDLCELGKWVNGIDVQYRDLPEFVELNHLHNQLHKSAADAVILAQAGKVGEARQYLSIDGGCVETSKLVLESAGKLLKKMDT